MATTLIRQNVLATTTTGRPLSSALSNSIKALTRHEPRQHWTKPLHTTRNDKLTGCMYWPGTPTAPTRPGATAAALAAAPAPEDARRFDPFLGRRPVGRKSCGCSSLGSIIGGGWSYEHQAKKTVMSCVVCGIKCLFSIHIGSNRHILFGNKSVFECSHEYFWN